MNTNWLLTRGLRMHGYAAEADDLAIRTAEMVERAGFWEFYDPFSGRGMGAENFGWSTLAVDMLDDLDPVPSARPRAASAVGISRVAS